MIHLEGVTKVYQTSEGEVQALGGVNLDVESGEFVSVRGPSGSGKSTLLTIVGTLGRPTSGKVVVSGEEVTSLSSSEGARFRAERIGFVFQTFPLFPYLTVVENVVAAVSSGGRANARHRAEALLERFQLSPRLGHRPAQLSTGECQRVAMARAMINKPSLILADEPTGNLDSENAMTVLKLLADYHQEGGTILLVTHEDRASHLAQRTVLLRDGQVESENAS